MLSLINRFGRSNSRANATSRSVGTDEISPVALAVRSRARAFRRRLDAMPVRRSGKGNMLAIAFIVSGWFYGSVVAGTASTVISGIGAGVGLGATDIVLTGQVETPEQKLIEALRLAGKPSLLGYDTAQARRRLLELPWVRDVAIRKLYPGKLTVAIAEKRAAAVWQHKDRLNVVDRSGHLIAKFGIADLLNNRFDYLPHLVGEGAPETASEILPIVGQFPVISERVTSYIRVADRRWNLGLANGIQVLLPETGLEAKLSRLAGMAERENLFERQLSVVDLRLQDRIVIRLQEEAVAERAKVVEARLKAMKRAEQEL